MFLKSLTISRGDGMIIRDIVFHNGLNLIIDETPAVSGKETGNNVGKTTVLKLIDFCLGDNAKGIYTDSENLRNEYNLVKDFLIDKKVKISLVLKENLLLPDSREVLIERNFLSRKDVIRRIDGKNRTQDEFDEALTDLLFPGHYGKMPSFRQIISHNFRINETSITNTLKTLHRYTRDDEYETLYLFLFGCDFEHGETRQNLLSQITIETTFRRRLESEQSKSAYETALALLLDEIDELEKRKASLNVNPNFEADFNNLNRVKYEINQLSSDIGRLELRKNIIIEAQNEIQAGKSNIDLPQLRQLYVQASTLVNGIHKTFQELYEFHNHMLESKARFVAQGLPKLESELQGKRTHLNRLLLQEREISEFITQSESFTELEYIVLELTNSYNRKGEYENILHQLNDVEDKLTELNQNLEVIDNELFSDEFALQLKGQVNKFNRHFSAVSNDLYGEKYALKVDTKKNRDGRSLYIFSAFNTNFSSGKKLGEISCFDIAYTLFADEENIPCMHFLLNDKKELMHDNQLLMIARLINSKGIQFIASMLKDKLPAELNKEEFVLIKLSQTDKLFRIEN